MMTVSDTSRRLQREHEIMSTLDMIRYNTSVYVVLIYCKCICNYIMYYTKESVTMLCYVMLWVYGYPLVVHTNVKLYIHVHNPKMVSIDARIVGWQSGVQDHTDKSG